MSNKAANSCEWKASFHKQLLKNNRSCSGFEALVGNYKQMCDKLNKSNEANTKLTRELKEARDLAASVAASTGIASASSQPTFVPAAKLQEYDDKIIGLQEELTAAFRQKAESAQQLLEVTKSVQSLSAELNAEKQVNIQHALQVKSLNEQITLLTTVRDQKQQSIEALRRAVNEKDRDFAILTAKLQKAEDENKVLIERMKVEKQKLIESMVRGMWW